MTCVNIKDKRITSFPELVTIKKSEIMKTLNFDLTNEMFDEFALSVDEMINVRGGDIEPTPMPTMPPIKI
jgi:hypothetical protein